MKIATTDKVPSVPTVPSLNDSYCWTVNSTEVHVNAHSIVRFTVVIVITLTIIFSNLVFIVTINSQIYSKISNQQSQFRYLLTCLAINDFTVGLLVTAVAIGPALVQCWPFSETVCQIQASLREVLPRQSVVILMCTAVDRYISVQHPRMNQKCCTNKVCMLTISLSLVLFLSVFATLVISRQGYYFNNSGLLACDVFYVRPSFRILSACMFYFPATMLFMYCYGSLYHFSYKKCSLNTLRNFNLKSAKSPLKREKIERQNKVISRKMSLISFMFIVTSTPWFINEMVVGGTGYRKQLDLDEPQLPNTDIDEQNSTVIASERLPVSSFFEFIFTYAALSNSFWNPFLYWTLDKHFRTSFVSILRTKNHKEKACSNTKSVHYCHNEINSISVIEVNVADKSGKPLENNIQIDSNFYPNCPTPPPPPRLKQTMIPLY